MVIDDGDIDLTTDYTNQTMLLSIPGDTALASIVRSGNTSIGGAAGLGCQSDYAIVRMLLKCGAYTTGGRAVGF